MTQHGKKNLFIWKRKWEEKSKIVLNIQGLGRHAREKRVNARI